MNRPPHTPNQEVWLVIPLYNEESVITQVITEISQYFSHIICVDDASSDASAQLAQHAGALVIRHPINLGQGAALQTGFTYVLQNTTANWVATFDADGQHQAQDVIEMYQQASSDDLGAVFGSRFLGSVQEMGFLKRMVLKTAAWFTARSTSMRLTDAHNGLRLLRRDTLERIYLRQNRMAHATEIVTQIGKAKVKWAEAPVHIRYTEYSKAKGQSVFNSVNILTDLVFGK